MKKMRVSIVVDVDTWEKFKNRALESRLSASFVARELLRKYAEGEIDVKVEVKT